MRPTNEIAGLEKDLRAGGFNTELRYGDADDPIAAVLALSDPFGNRVDLLVGLAHGPEDVADAEVVLDAAGESLDVTLLEGLAQRYGPDTLAAVRTMLAERSTR
jgi:hypothetical protein